MDDAEAQRQIQQMVNFILNEARDKAQEIEAKSLEDFNIEKLKIVQQMKDKVRQEYQRKAKQIETERAIARSTAVNKARLKKITARQKVIETVSASTGKQLEKITANTSQYKTFIVDLIVQAAIALLEKQVLVRCRPEDKDVVQSALKEAEQKYTKVIKDQVGISKTVEIQLDTKFSLPSGPKSEHAGKSCLGGVTVTTMDRKIKVDNTIDARLELVVRDSLPQIRQMLFP